jgi:DNA-binding beta-propeller fold protein YncE
MLRYLGGVALVLALTVGASGETGPPAWLVGKPPTLVAGTPWTATVRLRAPVRTPRLVARMGEQTVRFRLRPARTGVFRAVVRLSAGSWRLYAAVGSRHFPLAVVRVLPATFRLDQPAQIVVARDGSILVAERGLRDRIVRIDPVTGVVTPFAAGLSDPFGLTVTPDGSILASAGGAVHRIPAGGGRPVEVARLDAGPIVAAANGDLYYANRSEIGVLRAGSASPEVFPVRVNAPHGLVLDGDSLFTTDSGNGRILRVDLPARRATTVVANLRAPLGLAADRDELLTADYATGTVLRVSRAGAIQPIASRLSRPYALAVAGDAVYVVEAGDLGRPTGSIKRVLRDGTVESVRLRRP